MRYTFGSCSVAPAREAAPRVPAPRACRQVKVQIPKDASAGELVTFIHKGREVDAAMPANAKAGDEVR